MSATPETQKDKDQQEKTPLFREEAIRHRTRALFGEVVLAAPLSTWIITALLVIILLAVAGFAVFAHMNVDGISLPVWRWILGHEA